MNFMSGSLNLCLRTVLGTFLAHILKEAAYLYMRIFVALKKSLPCGGRTCRARTHQTFISRAQILGEVCAGACSAGVSGGVECDDKCSKEQRAGHDAKQPSADLTRKMLDGLYTKIVHTRTS